MRNKIVFSHACSPTTHTATVAVGGKDTWLGGSAMVSKEEPRAYEKRYESTIRNVSIIYVV